jgi:hypothetical protein
MTTTIMVSVRTLELLKEKKKTLGLKNMDAVLLHLLGDQQDQRDEDEMDRSRPKGRKAARKMPLKGDDAQLLSFAYFREKGDELQTLTGLHPDAVVWLVEQLQGQVRIFFSFLHVFLFCHSCASGWLMLEKCRLILLH